MHRRLVCIFSAAMMSVALGFPVRGAETTIYQTGASVMADCRTSEEQAEWIVSTWKPAEISAKQVPQNMDFPWVKSSMSPIWTAMGICLLTVVVMTWLESRE